MSVQTVNSRFLELGTLARLRHMKFTTRHIMEGTYSGRHRSRRRGGTSEFREHRQYSPGDDIRRLDWKVLGRTRRPYLRLYEDETNLVCTLVLDISGSMRFGAEGRDLRGSKLDYSSYVTAALSYIILKERDHFGLALASDRLEAFHPPGCSSNQLEKVVNSLETIQPRPRTALAPALRELFTRLRRRGLLVVVSDFLEDDLGDLFSVLRLFRYQHFGILLLHVLHPMEEQLPIGPSYRFEGLEGEGHRDCSTQEIADAYQRRFRRFRDGLRSHAAAAGCGYFVLSTAVPYVEHLKTLLVERRG
jgi:uncharacterized protein (DUF58 family)